MRLQRYEYLYRIIRIVKVMTNILWYGYRFIQPFSYVT